MTPRSGATRRILTHAVVCLGTFAAIGCGSRTLNNSPTAMALSNEPSNVGATYYEPIERTGAMSPEERERAIKKHLERFTGEVTLACRKQNLELRENGILPCPNTDDCPVNLIHRENGRSLNFSVVFSESNNNLVIYAYFSWRKSDRSNSIGFCYHASLMPMVQEFENALRHSAAVR
jgi:hypothetical protein